MKIKCAKCNKIIEDVEPWMKKAIDIGEPEKIHCMDCGVTGKDYDKRDIGAQDYDYVVHGIPYDEDEE